MELRRLAGGECPAGDDCPTVYVTDEGTALVQGYINQDHGLDVPSGEGVVAVPLALLLEAARRVGR